MNYGKFPMDLQTCKFQVSTLRTYLIHQATVIIVFTRGVRPSQNPKRATTDTLCENNDNLLAGAWWVILNSVDLLFSLPWYQTYFLS